MSAPPTAGDAASVPGMPLLPRALRVSVRRMAEALFRSGDLHFLYDAAVLPDEGQQAHRRLAARLGGEQEVRVEHRVVQADIQLRVGGRIDLLQALDPAQHDGARVRVCEFKSTRSDAARLHAHWASVHWAQVGLYAAMLVEAGQLVEAGEASDVIELALHYVHVDTDEAKVFHRRATRAELRLLLDDACTRWLDVVRARQAWRARRDASLATLPFPHPAYRPRQRALAAAAYRAHRDGTTLLCEAPTGLGKTLSFLFPALKAMADGHTSRLFYLTARGTGQRSAIDALATLAGAGAQLRPVQLVARDKACLTPGAACTGDECMYARGHHDRVGGALEALRARAQAFAEDMLAVARAHVVCPFALSLAHAAEADVVVCDYNYVLDPFVRSARLLADDARHTSVLLDEVHQLPERAQEMHSAALRASTFRDAAVGAPRGTRTLLRDIARRVDGLLAGVRGAAIAPAPMSTPAPSIALAEAMDAVAELDHQLARFSERALPLLTPEQAPAFRAAFLAATAWRAVQAFTDRAPYALVAGDEGSLQRLCIDASALVAGSLAPFRSVQAFSATLPGGGTAPPLGLPEPFAHWQVPPVFPARNMATFVLTDIDVTLKARAGTLTRLATTLAGLIATRAGNYLVFVPSFAYLEALADAFVAGLAAASAGVDPDAAPECFVQQRGSDDAARAAFLARFRDDGRTRVGFAVTGGLFGESVDLPGGALIGVVIVGVSLAPPTPARDLLRAHLRSGGARDADAVAYDIPAMVRVRQTAGRLIRTPEDRGVLVLVDARFAHPRFRRWLPGHWALQPVAADALAAAATEFWACDDLAGTRGGTGTANIAPSA